ncbi:MAG TPA: hypothetical protein VLD18_09030 [Verrucomicrobiae bacterium]|nr:hypothetical protein [Verrucomicrobiae bacterium]
MKLRLKILLTIALLSCAGAWACRYSVRDTGFVDLGEESYRLVLSGRDLGDQAELYRQISAASLLDANISFAVNEDPNLGESALTLEDTQGRKLVLARGNALPTNATDATTLVESVALSPLRAQIHEQALDAFAVVVLVEGGRESDLARVQASIETAIRNIARLMPSMPKPVDTPPVLIRVTPEQLARERVTLWGLGLDPEPVAEPRVALVFGRGRRIGSPLEGPLITQTVLEQHLVIIGQDCECELDREWMKGPLLPARWDADRQRQAVQHLGFDPENPLVRAEVSRIVLRGPGTGQFRKLSGNASALGYSEVLIEDLPMNDVSASVEVNEPPPPAPVPTGTVAPEEPAPTMLASENPLERPRLFTWIIFSGSSLAVLTLAALWWRKIRREQG